MRHLACKKPGDTSVLYFKEGIIPKPMSDEYLVKIAATALNRADLLQRRGMYPPPKGYPDIIGLEASGYIINPTTLKIEDKQPIMMLLPSGGFSQYITVKKNHTIKVPKNVSVEEAAAIPETWLTSYLCCNLANVNSKAKKQQNVMIYAAASGVGISLIQLASYYGSKIFCSVSTDKQFETCKILGAQKIYNFDIQKEQDIYKSIQVETQNQGINTFFDSLGSKTFEFNLNAASDDSTVILYGLMTGTKIKNLDISKLLFKRVKINPTTLKSRSDDFKAELISNFSKEIVPLFNKKKFKVILDSVLNVRWDDYSLSLVKKAHQKMQQNKHIGKIVFRFD